MGGIVGVVGAVVEKKTGACRWCFLQSTSGTGCRPRYTTELADDGDRDPAAVGGGSMFPDVDPLPGSQVARTVGDGE